MIKIVITVCCNDKDTEYTLDRKLNAGYYPNFKFREYHPRILVFPKETQEKKRTRVNHNDYNTIG